MSKAAPCAGQDKPGAREVVVLAQDEVGSDIAGCPRCEEGRCSGTELVQQVAELYALGRVEERTGHTAGVYRDPVFETTVGARIDCIGGSC